MLEIFLQVREADKYFGIVSFLWNFFISREASTAGRRYMTERWSENYMHMAAFSTRTCLLLPLSSFPPSPSSHSPLSNAITGEPPCAPFLPPPLPPRGFWTDFSSLAQIRGWPPFWRLWVWYLNLDSNSDHVRIFSAVSFHRKWWKFTRPPGGTVRERRGP